MRKTRSSILLGPTFISRAIMLVKIAGIQFKPSNDFRDNVKRAITLIEKATDNGAELVCLPEYFYSSEPFDTIVKKSGEISENIGEEMEKIAKKKKITIVYNIPKNENEKITNTSVIIDETGKLGEYSKINLFSKAPFYEDKYFERGKTAEVFDSKVGKIGIVICNDLRFPEIFRNLALKGAKIILVPSAFRMEVLEVWKELLTLRAAENKLFVFGVNLIGKDSKTEYAGHTQLVSPDGKTIAESQKNEEEIILAEINL